MGNWLISLAKLAKYEDPKKPIIINLGKSGRHLFAIRYENKIFTKAKSFILSKLRKELPDHLFYHSVAHVKDVYEAAAWLAKEEGISKNDTKLLLTAALFHDSGFIFGAKDHEQRSCEIAEEHLPRFGYSQSDIVKIKGMIMATQIPQSPKNHLEQILADADLDYLGRDDFYTIGNSLFEELSFYDIISNVDDWNRLQLKFLENHSYFTDTAIKNRKAKKEENYQSVKAKLN